MSTKTRLLLVLFAFIGVAMICSAVYFLIYFSKKDKEQKKKREKGLKSYETPKQSLIEAIGSKLVNDDLQKIFDNAKNPWNMTKATFQFIRFGGLIICSIIGIILIPIKYEVALFAFGIGILFVWYPMYYYKAIGEEREAEWCKMYEFIWVIKHNAMLYDPAKTYINVRNYIAEHAPNDKELIQGFEDFYKYWNDDQIDDYINRHYNFSIPREITQIIFNMNKTGEFPEEQLNSLRGFIINIQNLTVEKTLSGVAGSATVYSLPFMMVSVIISLMVPMLVQLLGYM